MNYQERSGFEPYDMSWNDDESTPRTDLGDLLNPINLISSIKDISGNY